MKKLLLLTLFAGWFGVSAYGQTTHHSSYESETLNTSIFLKQPGNKRYTGNLIVTNVTTGAATTITGLQTCAEPGTVENGNYMMYDKTSVVIEARVGDHIRTSNTVGQGTGGMQKQIYIDWNNDGYFGPNNPYVGLGDFLDTTDENKGRIINDELATYHRIQFPPYNADSWWGPNHENGGQGQRYDLQLNFTIPENKVPGEYRVRYKYGWSDLDPMSASFNNNGGIVVDFTLRIKGAMEYDEAVAELAAYKAGSTVLTLSRLFTAEQAAAAFYDITIDENAADFEAELDAKKAAVDAAAMPALCNYLNGKKVAFRNNSGGRYIKKTNSDGRMSRGSNVLTLDAVWQLSFSGEEFTMKNLVDNKYAKNLMGNIENEADAGHYKFVRFNILNNGTCAIQDMSTNNSEPWLNDNTVNANNLQYKASGSGNTSTFWYITIITEEQEQAWIDEIKARFSLPIGTKPSTVVINDTDAYEAAQLRTAAVTLENLYSEGYAMTNLAVDYTVNPVVPGTLIRIKSNRGWYYSVTGGGASFVENPDAGTLFYYSPYTDADKNIDGGHLVSLDHGVAARPNSDYPGMLRGATTAAENANLAANAKHVFFEVASTIAPRYHFNFYNVNEKRFVHNAGTAGINGGMDVTATTNDYQDYTYTVEQVDEITVTISSFDGTESLISPVALTVPVADDAKFYSCSTAVNTKGETVLAFTEMNAGATIAANTPVMVKAPDGTVVNVPVKYDNEATAVLMADDNRFAGSYLTLPLPTVEKDKALFVKTGDSFELPEGMANTGNEYVNFKRVNKGETVPAGAVTVLFDDDTTTNNNIYLALGENNGVTTAITEVAARENAESGVIFDLQGRKLANPVHGINIINGRKVMVK